MVHGIPCMVGHIVLMLLWVYLFPWGLDMLNYNLQWWFMKYTRYRCYMAAGLVYIWLRG